MRTELEQELGKRDEVFRYRFLPLASAIDEATIVALEDKITGISGESTRAIVYSSISNYAHISKKTDGKFAEFVNDQFNEEYGILAEETLDAMRETHEFFLNPLTDLTDFFILSHISHHLTSDTTPRMLLKSDLYEEMKRVLQQSVRFEVYERKDLFIDAFIQYIFNTQLADVDMRAATLSSEYGGLFSEVHSDFQHLGQEGARRQTYNVLGTLVLTDDRVRRFT